MLRVFQRACIRAGINIQYTRGFNPHPKLSLPLPKPVGVESEEELLSLRINFNPLQKPVKADNLQITNIESLIRDALTEQLPEGCTILSVSIPEIQKTSQPFSAAYVFTLKKDSISDKLKMKIQHILASESITIQRQNSEKGPKSKNLDIRSFLKSINMEGNDIIVDCRITPAGSVRVEEIMQLLELNTGMLETPIRRTGVQWQEN